MKRRAPLSRGVIQSLTDGTTLSVKWRGRFEEAAWRLDG